MSEWVNLITAPFTAITFPLFDSVESCFAAGGASVVTSVFPDEDIIKTRIIIWIFCMEILNSVSHGLPPFLLGSG